MTLNVQLRELLEEKINGARAAWPEFEVDTEKFAAYLASYVDTDAPVPALEQLKINDLFLCFACLNGDEHALVAFEDIFLPLVRRNIGKLSVSESAVARYQ